MKFLLSLMLAAVVMGPGVARAEQIALKISTEELLAICGEEGDASECIAEVAREAAKSDIQIVIE